MSDITNHNLFYTVSVVKNYLCHNTRLIANLVQLLDTFLPFLKSFLLKTFPGKGSYQL